MKARLHRWRRSAHLARRIKAQSVFMEAVGRGAQDGAAAFANGAEAPPEPKDDFEFSCCWSWRKRRNALHVGRTQGYLTGFWVGWNMAESAQEFFSQLVDPEVETTADKMIRDAEAYANRRPS